MSNFGVHFRMAAVVMVIFATAGGRAWSAQQEVAKDEPRATGLRFLGTAQYERIPLSIAPLMGDLPPAIDLSDKFPKPGNQGRQGSCVGWAVAYGLKTYQEGVERNWSLVDPSHQFSAAFIYNQIKRGPDCSGGSQFVDALNLLSADGAATLKQFPYSDSDCSRKPDNESKDAAKEFKIAGWRRVNILDPTEVKAQIASGFPVLIGMVVDDGFMHLKTDVYTPSGVERGGHAMVIVGYSDTKSAYRVLNSWGEVWGDRGFGWIGYPAAREKIREAYIAQDRKQDDPAPSPPKPGPIPDPKPTPTPPPAPSWDPVVPGVTHNLPVVGIGGTVPGMAIDLHGIVRSVRGRNLTVVTRFTYPNSLPLRANPQERVYRDVFGNVAIQGVIPTTTNDIVLDGQRAFIPYYAMNFQPTGGQRSHFLKIHVDVYVDSFLIGSSTSVEWTLVW